MDYTKAVETFSDMVWRICRVRLNGNNNDAADAYQDTFVRYFTHLERGKSFHDENHRKAWLIRAAISSCEDIRRKKATHTTVTIDELKISDDRDDSIEPYVENPDMTIFSALLELPVKYRTVIQLYYCEGFSCDEISSALRISSSAVRMRLKRGRDKLAKLLDVSQNADSIIQNCESHTNSPDYGKETIN